MQDLSSLWQLFYDTVNGVEVNSVSAVYRLLLSMFLGSVVGYERKRKGQSAGVRTFSLIAMGATLAMLLSIYVPQEYLGLKNGDPGRIAAQVLSGIGFLGAGAIIQMKGSIRGLTTAAGIWMVATIGLAVGVGMYWVSIIATALILFILVQLERIEHRISLGSESRIIRLKLDGIVTDIAAYRSAMAVRNVVLVNYFVEYDYVDSQTSLNLVVLSKETVDYIALFTVFEKLYPTRSITLTNSL